MAYLTLGNNSKELAATIEEALKNKSEYEKLSRHAKNLSLSYNWDNTAEVMLKLIKENRK